MERINLNEDKVDAFLELWETPEVKTISVRRHGEWSYDHNQTPVGALTPEGLRETKEAASTFSEKIPDGAKVEVYESPSFIPSCKTSKQVIKPQRARISASIYENVIFGNQSSAATTEDGQVELDYVGNPISDRRIETSLLGDIFESTDVDKAQYIKDFLTLKKKKYENSDAFFWRDFVTDKLPAELKEALHKAGGSDSLQLAKNISNFITSLEKNGEGREDKNKEVYLAISHGETIGSFLHYLKTYLVSQGKGERLSTEFFGEDINYNDGFDLHKKDEEVTLVRNGESVSFNYLDFKKYLDNLSH